MNLPWAAAGATHQTPTADRTSARDHAPVGRPVCVQWVTMYTVHKFLALELWRAATPIGTARARSPAPGRAQQLTTCDSRRAAAAGAPLCHSVTKRPHTGRRICPLSRALGQRGGHHHTEYAAAAILIPRLITTFSAIVFCCMINSLCNMYVYCPAPRRSHFRYLGESAQRRSYILSKQKIFHCFMHMRAKTICGF